MSFGILSGTTSSGLGCCAPALSATARIAAANAKRFMTPPGWTAMEISAQGGDAGLGDLFVFVRLHAGDADRADAGAIHDDRQAALHRRHARHAQELGPLADALLPGGGRAPGLGGGAALLYRDARIGRRRAVHAGEVQQVSAVVEDRDAHVPAVLLRLRFRGGGNFLAVVEREHRSRLHRCRAFLICSSALGSSMVVRSPGSRPSASAWIERRSVLPERVFGSSVTKCTAFGRAIAPSCLSTVSITSWAEVAFAVSLSTANASGIWPLSSSATPTTAHSPMFRCM